MTIEHSHKGCLALIPARGGSKRIPRKNIRPFAGRPMIAHAISLAQDSGLFESVLVSTDDPEVAEVARTWGAEVPFMRPASLADDHTPTVPVVAHALSALRAAGRQPQVLCCIYPAVPLLLAQDLQEGLRMLHRLPALEPGYVFPVLAFESPVQRALRRAADGRTGPMYSQFTQTRSQDLEPAFHDAGQFYWAHAHTWINESDIHGHARTFVMPAQRVVDIDTPDDWARAEALYAIRGACD